MGFSRDGFARSERRTQPKTPATLTEFVMAEVVQTLASGTLAPGDRVSPELLARRLGISHIPVREALRVLAAEGHLRQEPRRGFFVPELSQDEIEENNRLRTILEEEAMARGAPLLTAADLAHMRKLIRVMDRAHRSWSPHDYQAANREFHFVPFRKVDSVVLLRFLDYLWVAVARNYLRLLGSGHDVVNMQRDHRLLVDLLERGDVAAANRLMRSHREAAWVPLGSTRSPVGQSRAGRREDPRQPSLTLR